MAAGRLVFHLAPPLLARRDPLSGHPKKMQSERGYAHFPLPRDHQSLRTTAFDPFGWTAERRTERRLINDYETLVARLLVSLRSIISRLR